MHKPNPVLLGRCSNTEPCLHGGLPVQRKSGNLKYSQPVQASFWHVPTLPWCRLTAGLSFASSRNSFHPSLECSVFYKSAALWAKCGTAKLAWALIREGQTDLCLCPSLWHLWVAARAAADGEFGEKGGEIGHRCVTCTQADGTWVDQDPLQGLWDAAEMPPPPGAAVPREFGGWDHPVLLSSSCVGSVFNWENGP